MSLRLALILLILIGISAFVLVFQACDDDDDDDAATMDDDDATDDDDGDDDDFGDDDDGQNNPPEISNLVAFPDFPAGPDLTFSFIWTVCDADGDLTGTAGYELLDTQGQAVWGQFEFGNHFADNDPTDCTYSNQWFHNVDDQGGNNPGQYDLSLKAWDNAGNQSDDAEVSFWVPEYSDSAPVLSDAKVTKDDDSGQYVLSMGVCDVDNDILQGRLSVINPQIIDGKSYPHPAFIFPYFIKWDSFIFEDVGDCIEPLVVEIPLHNPGPGDYCWDLVGTDSMRNPSNYVTDVCFTVE